MNTSTYKKSKMKGADPRGSRLLAMSVVSAVSGLGLFATTSVQAQVEGGSSLEEVVVTARKKEENLQSVPVTVTALTAAAVEKMQIKNIFELATVTPGLYYGTSGGRNGGNKLQIRNFSTGTAGPSKASVFIDGVYMAGDYGSIPLANLERIEVLKGPQSAYFGRATFVGAVNFITRDPGNEFAGNVDVMVASHDERDITGFLSLPIIDDVLSQQFTVREYSFEGPDEWRTTDGYHLGDQSTKSISSKTVITPNEDLTFKLGYTRVEDDDHLPPVLYNDPTKRVPVARPDGTFGYYFNGPTRYEFSAPSWGLPTSAFTNPGIRHEQDRLSLHYEMNVSGHTVSGFIAHNQEKFEEQLDGNLYLSGTSPAVVPNAQGVPTPVTFASSIFNYLLEERDDQFEFRVNSPSEQRIRYTFGYNHSRITGHSQLFTLAGVAVFNGNNYGGSFLNPATNDSVFGGLYWDATERITLTAEGRYQREEIEAKSYSIAPANYGAVISDAVARYYAFLPRFNFQYKLNDDVQFYAIYSEGNNPGGFQPITQAQAAAAGIRYNYDEEEITNYEAGIKSSWLEGRLTVNAAVFHMDFDKEQLSQTSPVPGTPTGFASLYLPGVAAKVDGLELEVNSIVANDLQIRATVGYGKAEYKSFCSTPYGALTGIHTNAPPGNGPFNCRSVAGKQQEGTPALQTSLSADYSHDLFGDWRMYIRPDWQYQSKVYNEEWNQSWVPAHSMYNLRAGIENGSWTFEGFVKNASDDDNTTRSTRVTDGRLGAITGSYPTLNGFSQGVAGQQNVAGTAKKPRQYGLRVSYSF